MDGMVPRVGTGKMQSSVTLSTQSVLLVTFYSTNLQKSLITPYWFFRSVICVNPYEFQCVGLRGVSTYNSYYTNGWTDNEDASDSSGLEVHIL